ncbi:MAG: c-type cytochrome [Methylophagaceae bacterium]
MKKWLLMIVMSFAAVTLPSLAAGDIAAGKIISAQCAACHGVDGNSSEPSFPKLAGQGEGYLYKQLLNFASGTRESLIMGPMIADISAQGLADLSAYYASQKVTAGLVSESLIEQGQKLYRAGNKKTGVPACMSCHGPRGAGIPAAKWPALSGQHARYVEMQLDAFSQGDRNNDPNDMMRDISSRLSADEKKAVSAYISALY